MKDVLRPGEEEEEWEADGEEVGADQMGAEEVGEVHEHDAGTQSKPDQATAIIAELAAAHCLSSIHDPLRWLQDIGNFVQVPSVDDESLLSLVVRCRGMMGKDIRINFMIMINFMTLVCLHLKGIYENEVKDRPSETKSVHRIHGWNHALTSSRHATITSKGAFTPLRRSGHVWRACIAPVPTDLQRLPLHTVNHKQVLQASRDKVLNTSWSAAERLRAEAGERVKSLEDLRNKLKTFYRNGVKKLTWCILTNLNADHAKDLLEIWIRACLEVDLSRLCTSLVQSPLYIDVQPWLLEKEGMRTNHGQVIPYISQDLQQHRLVYGTISKVYGELFEWVRQLMENYLQEEFEMLMEVASVLPGNALPPVVPFISLVININVRTKAHRDSGDRHLCLVIPIGHFEGGALCLLENGLVLELRNGDIAIFRSSKGKRPPSPTSSAPPASNKGKTKASKVITDDQYDEFLKFQAQKRRKLNSIIAKSIELGLRKNVDAMLDEEESNTEHEITEHNKRKKVSKKAKPMDTDEEVEDDANPDDILPHLDPKKKNTPIASEDSDHSRHPEADSAIDRRSWRALIEVKDESQDEMAVRRRRRGANKGEVRPPTTLASLKKDGCGPLVDLAHQLLRVKIALENAFPGPSVDVQDAFAWNCIKEAGKESGSPMKVMFDRISEDDTLKGRALAYVWSGASQLRGELARKARENVIFMLQHLRPKEIADIANWVISTRKEPFLSGEMDIKAKTFNKNLPFRTHLIKQLLMGQFFQGAGAEGLLYKEEFQKLPDNLIALLAASIECAYKGMLTGTPVVVEFKEPVFQPRHQYYLSKLTEYSLKTPGYMKKLRDDLWTDIGEACRFQLREEGGDSDESDVDFDAMEEYARPMSGVANVDDAVVN
ncbi:hypothetical protein DFJ58DRAFT_846661 [Suillus subalutaceus]|uniref:uncharacterized protein n=1 Tax=Suillus subalutaceus TaxID=48586 RepID=UPI001B86AE83|nr:uncharacterized protein DFJ58DRAFT_846661 [Suillus subalutaceus]KAG1837056.1 hypothetical protein DFJ58DRAFT_846661 [Suillus subalutaceus]